MTLKVALVHSNDDGFSLGVEMLRATVADRVPAGDVDHRVWFHAPSGDLSHDYLGQYNLLLARLFSWQPDVVAFSVYVWNHDDFARLSQLVRRHLPGTRIVWGGAQVSSRRMADQLLRTLPWLDVVVRGEAEDSYPELLTALHAGSPLDQVRGLSWRRDGEPVHNEDAAKVDLRGVPLVFDPATLDLPAVVAQPHTNTIAYETGRGCRQHCQFCLYGVPALRAFDLERVAQELRYVLASRPPFLRICDAHFGISRTRAMELFEIIEAHNETSVVEIYPDTRHVDAEYVAAMTRSGCRVVSLGIQSSDADTLALAQRRFDVEVFDRAVRLIREGHNPDLAADIIIGMPGDNLRKVERSVDFAFAHGISKVHFAPLMAFPGTEIYEHAESFDLEFMPFQPPLAVESRGFSAADYRRAMTMAARVELVQEQAPTMVRCVVASGARLTDLVRELPCELDEVPLWASRDLDRQIVECCTAEAAELVADGLAWDRWVVATARLAGEPRPAESELVVGVCSERVLTLGYPVHELLTDPFLGIEGLPRGTHRYVLPVGGVAVYPVQGPLAAALDSLRPGLSVAQWRAELHASDEDWAAALLDDAVGVLLAAGIVATRPDGFDRELVAADALGLGQERAGLA